MKKHLIICSVIITLSVILTGTSVIKSKSDKINNTTDEQILYILKDYKGKIATFIGDDETPAKIYNIKTDSLPQADALKIKEGIIVYSEDELNNLIYDYTS